MAHELAKSLLENKGFVAHDVAKRFVFFLSQFYREFSVL